MNITNQYEVIFENFAERHFIRTFAKKYKGSWDITINLLADEFKFIDVLFSKSIAEYITDKDADIVICKIEFKIAGTQQSRHGSGNRCIVAIHKNTNKVCVLLIYHKNNLRSGNETAKWKTVIRNNYSEYKNIL